MRRLIPLLLCACEVVGGPVSASTTPCTGGRTDTLFIDSGGTLYLGCGEASEGLGLFSSTNQGNSWTSVSGFEEFRVSDVSESGGTVYIAGIDTSGSDRVRTLDGTSVFEATNQLWNTFHVGTFVRQDSGLAIAESLTGSGMAFRASDDAAWADASPWVGDGGFQMLDVVDDNGTMVGVGSTIIQPHTVFVQDDGAHFQEVTLGDDSFTGELWAVDAGGGYAAGGVDQDADQGMIYVNDGDPTAADQWIATRIPYDTPTWVRDVCRDGDDILAVGVFTQRDEGFAYRSSDGGVSFTEISLPEDTPALYNCWLDGDTAMIAGAQGYFGRL